MKLNPNGTSNDKKPWADEPTPLCAPYYGHWATTCTDRGTIFDVASDLERRLRHAGRLLGTIRIDCMLDGPDKTLDLELLEQRLGELEEVLDPAQPV